MDLQNIVANKYVNAVLIILTTVYVSMGMVQLPTFIRSLFRNNIFRLVFLSLLLVYRFDNAPHVAFLVSLIFVATMYYIGQVEMLENVAYLEHYCEKTNADRVDHFCEKTNIEQQ